MTVPRRDHDWIVWLPLLVAGVLITAGSEDFGFDPAGWIDPFAYFGYFWHYPDHLPRLDADYKSSRLPWILPGYVAHLLASPAAASYLLVLVTLSAGGVALYLLIRDVTHDRAAAGVFAAAWTSCTWAHGVGGWNYHMLAAADYFLVSSWLAFRCARASSPSSAMVGGACAAAAVHTHLFFAAFLPLLALTYWSGLLPEARNLHRMTRDGGLAVAGAIGITAGLATVNVATGGDWLFFMPQVEQARRLMRHDDWWLPPRDWLPTATYLIVPIVLMSAALVILVIERRRLDRAARVAIVQAWLALGVMGVAQFVRHQATLNPSYLGFPLYVYAFLAGGAALATAKEHARVAATIVLSAVLMLLPLVQMSAAVPRLMNVAVATFTDAHTARVVPPFLFGLLGGMILLITRSRGRLWVFVTLFTVLNAWIAPAPAAYDRRTPGYRRQMLELIREADQFTAGLDPSLDGIKYWWRIDERLILPAGHVPLASIFDSFVSTRSWQVNLLAHDPGVPVEQLTLENLDRAACVGLLSSPLASDQTAAMLQARFASLGRPLRRISAKRLERPPVAFNVTILMPVDAPKRSGPPCNRR